MKNNSPFTVYEGLSFTVTTESKNIKILKRASKKYHVDIPNVQYFVVCTDDEIKYFFELDGYIDYAFGIPTDSLKDRDRLKTLALMYLVNNLDNMPWSGILKNYLLEKGIDYEG